MKPISKLYNLKVLGIKDNPVYDLEDLAELADNYYLEELLLNKEQINKIEPKDRWVKITPPDVEIKPRQGVMIEDVEGYDNNKIYIKLGSFLEIDEVQLFVKIGEEEYKKIRKKNEYPYEFTLLPEEFGAVRRFFKVKAIDIEGNVGIGSILLPFFKELNLEVEKQPEDELLQVPGGSYLRLADDGFGIPSYFKIEDGKTEKMDLNLIKTNKNNVILNAKHILLHNFEQIPIPGCEKNKMTDDFILKPGEIKRFRYNVEMKSKDELTVLRIINFEETFPERTIFEPRDKRDSIRSPAVLRAGDRSPVEQFIPEDAVWIEGKQKDISNLKAQTIFGGPRFLNNTAVYLNDSKQKKRWKDLTQRTSVKKDYYTPGEKFNFWLEYANTGDKGKSVILVFLDWKQKKIISNSKVDKKFFVDLKENTLYHFPLSIEMPDKEKEFTLVVLKISMETRLTPWNYTNTDYITLKPK